VCPAAGSGPDGHGRSSVLGILPALQAGAGFGQLRTGRAFKYTCCSRNTDALRTWLLRLGS